MKQQRWRVPILCITGSLFLILYHSVDRIGVIRLPFRWPMTLLMSGLSQQVTSACAAFVILGIIPGIAGCALWNERPSQWGLGLGQNRLKKAILALVLLVLAAPVVAYVATFPYHGRGHRAVFFALSYPKGLVLFETAAFFFVLGWEFFFRGFLLFGLHRVIGNAAIYVLIVPAAALGLLKFPAAALAEISLALVLGHLAIRTGSIWYGFFLHWLCLLIFDLSIIYPPF